MSLKRMTTNVKGFFNPNSYRINVSIPDLGVLVQLNPMEFILERGTGRKINDPILDKYVGYKMLSAEISDTPVPVVAIPQMPRSQAIGTIGVAKRPSGKNHIKRK
jgi:hypothetical protein